MFNIDLVDLTDHVETAWPMGWQLDVGQYGFFRLAGSREFFVSLGVYKASHQWKSLKPFLKDVLLTIEHENREGWWDFYFENEQYRELMATNRSPLAGIDNLVDATAVDVLAGKANSFSKTLLVALTFAAFLKRRGIQDAELVRMLQVRYVGYYVEGFGQAFKAWDETVRRLVFGYTLQSEQTLDQLAEGRPVTKLTADRVFEFMASQTADVFPPKFSLMQHQNRDAVRDTVIISRGSGADLNDSMKAADGENVVMSFDQA